MQLLCCRHLLQLTQLVFQSWYPDFACCALLLFLHQNTTMKRVVLQLDPVDQLRDNRLLDLAKTYNISTMTCGYCSFAFARIVSKMLAYVNSFTVASLKSTCDSQEFVGEFADAIIRVAQQRIHQTVKVEMENGVGPSVGVYEMSGLIKGNTDNNIAFARPVWRLPGTEDMWHDLTYEEEQCLAEEEPFLTLNPPAFIEEHSMGLTNFTHVKQWNQLHRDKTAVLVGDYKGHYCCCVVTEMPVEQVHSPGWAYRSKDWQKICESSLSESVPSLIVLNSLPKWNSMTRDLTKYLAEIS